MELFLQSSRPDGASGPLPELDDEAIARAVETTEKMLTSKDAAAMVCSPDATFVCLAMALEEKPKLASAALGCYEKALEYIDRRGAKSNSNGGWERCVVLQQLGAVSLRIRRLQEAHRWLQECSEAAAQTEGHPRDAVLFNGSFNTQQTRSEFASMVEKMRAKAYLESGDQQRAKEHINEAKRLEELATGDAVARQVATSSAKISSTPGVVDAVRELWSSQPSEEKRLKQYSYMDEGPTVLLILELNDHLGIGAEASAAVESLRQFKVSCEEKSVDIQLRLRRADGRLWHFRLLLEPLTREIVPEDTVPRLRGKDAKRRLEVKLFKRDKSQKWYGDLVSDGVAKPKDAKPNSASGAMPKGSLLNPLTPEELAALPKPFGGNSDNRPSTWAPSTSVVETVTSKASNAHLPVAKATLPRWIEEVKEERGEVSVQISITVSSSAGDVSMKDLGLDADGQKQLLCLHFLKDDPGIDNVNSTLTLPLPPNVDVDNLSARWRQKTRTLEIDLPCS